MTVFYASLDLWVESNPYPNNTFDGVDLRIGRSGTEWDDQSLLNFNISSIPVSAIVNSATLYLHDKYGGGSAGNVYKITSSWGGSTTYNTRPSFNGTSRGTIGTLGAAGWVSINLTTLVAEWVLTPSSMYGIILIGAGSTDGSRRIFESSSAGSNVPYLDISYSIGGAQCRVSHWK